MKILLVASLITYGPIAAAIFASPAANTPVPVLLELFTSEGRSSCPPADLIVMSEHVDYWNYPGWSGPYSSPLFSARQQRYAASLGASVYTPQLVLDGRFQAIGSDQGKVTAAIARAVRKAKLPVSVRAMRTGNGGTVHVEANGSGKNADLYVAIAADRLSSHVLRGENGGKTLTHVAVTQSIVRVGKWEGFGLTERDVPLTAKQLRTAQASGLRVIAILQDPQTGRIRGVAQARM